MIETVAVTGGNGRLGSATIRELSSQDYRTVNLSRGARDEDLSDEYFFTDLLDAGSVYGTLARSNADAVIHTGTLPSPLTNPGYETFKSNVMTSYHVLEAAMELGLEAVCLSSSINALGATFQDEPMDIVYLPVDEEHPKTPRDPYAIGKEAMERIGDGFGRMQDTSMAISSLRFPWIAYPEELEQEFVENERTLERLRESRVKSFGELFAYIDIRDAARATCKAIESSWNGHEIFWIVAPDTTAEIESSILAAEFYSSATVREPLSANESLIDISKARDLLGWKPIHSWRE